MQDTGDFQLPATLEGWLQFLVAIPSVNTAQFGPRAAEYGPAGEGKISEVLAEVLRNLGGKVIEEEVPEVTATGAPISKNLYAFFEGRDSSKTIAYDGHLDTVTVEHYEGEPFDAKLEAGRVHGRGSVDTKALTAVMLRHLQQMQERGLKPKHNLLVVLTVDEEVMLTGARKFRDWVFQSGTKIDQLIIAEPTMCQPVCAHRGSFRIRCDVVGEAAHSSEPDLGVNAAEAVCRIGVAMAKERASWRQNIPEDELLGFPNVTTSILQSGSSVNTVPSEGTIYVVGRFVRGQNVSEEMKRMMKLITESAFPAKVKFTVEKEYQAFFQDPSTDWVKQMVSWSGQDIAGMMYGTNALLYREEPSFSKGESGGSGGVAEEILVFGPGSIDQAHKEVEWVSVEQLELSSKVIGLWLDAA